MQPFLDVCLGVTTNDDVEWMRTRLKAQPLPTAGGTYGEKLIGMCVARVPPASVHELP